MKTSMVCYVVEENIIGNDLSESVAHYTMKLIKAKGHIYDNLPWSLNAFRHFGVEMGKVSDLGFPRDFWRRLAHM